MVLLVLVGQALGIRPEHLSTPVVPVLLAASGVPGASSAERADVSKLARSNTGAAFELAITVIECNELEEDDEWSSTTEDQRVTHARAADPLAGLFARYVAALPWGEGHEARDISVSRHLLLGVFRL